MSGQSLLGRVPRGFRLQAAVGFALTLLEKIMRLFIGNLKIRYAEGLPLVHRHVADAITQIIRPCFPKFSTPAKPPFFNRKDHIAPFTIICSMSLNRNRTAPRILTVANFPDATSLSTILLEQARRKAT